MPLRFQLVRGAVSASLLSVFVLSHARALDQPQQQGPAVHWESGPMKAHLGSDAEIDVPQGFLFANGEETRKFLEITQNPASGKEVGLIAPRSEKETWFVLFEYESSGYVKDDEKSSIDADSLLRSIQDGTEESNKERKNRGWVPFHVTGWYTRPFYDQQTHNLTWAITGQQDNAANPDVNYSVRMLGRRGIMHVDLVLGPEEMVTVEPRFKQMMNGFQFTQGSRYADFVKGDKVASYGLTALIAGGAGAVAAKTGLLAKLWKFIVGGLAALWKLLVIVFAAALAGMKRLWTKITGRGAETLVEPPSSIESPATLSETDQLVTASPQPEQKE